MALPPLRSEVLLAALDRPGSPYAAVDVRTSVTSTNILAREAGLVWHPVVADEQTAGSGRLARSWSTPPGMALAVSVLVPATTTPGWVPLAAGYAMVRTLRDVAGVQAVLKWPNDVLLVADGERKVCGILCELTPAGVVVGTGLNLTQQRADLPVETATSLALAGAEVSERESLLAAYLLAFAVEHARIDADPVGLREDYLRACRTVGSDVEVSLPVGPVRTGHARGVDPQGRLVVSGPDGGFAVSAGDVVHVRPAPGGR